MFGLREIVTVTALLSGVVSYEYGSFHNTHPPFQFIRSRFNCVNQRKHIIWNAILVQVHPGGLEDCGTSIERTQDPELWTSVDRCINYGDTESVEECKEDAEYGIVLQLNTTKLTSNPNITFTCAVGSELPEILAIHLIYYCFNGHDDILTFPPSLPPIPPSHGSDSSSLPPPPPQPDPTMGVEPTVQHTPGHGHIIVTDPEITTSTTKEVENATRADTMESGKSSTSKSVQEGGDEKGTSHTITYNELAVIVGPSTAVIGILIIALIVAIVIVKKKKLKLHGDLQGESLFYSRRFSTASQLSDISANGQQLRTVP